MKQLHGKKFKLLLFTFLLPFIAFGDSKYCSYEIKSNKHDVMLHEAVHITFHTRQKIHNEVMFFDLKPQENDSFEIILLNQKRHEFNYHDAEKSFSFLLIPKKIGIIEAKFNFRVRLASDDAVAQAYTGSRDNVKSIPTIKVPIEQLKVKLFVEPLQNSVYGVGDFTMEMKVDKTSTDIFSAINVTYKVEGSGYLDKSYEPLSEIEGVDIFRGVKLFEHQATDNGYKIFKQWSYALLAKNDFTLPATQLEIFSVKKHDFSNLKNSSKKISVKQIDISTLLDDKEAPIQTDYLQIFIDYIFYILTFIAGFLSALSLKYLPLFINKKRVKKRSAYYYKVKKSQSAKNLLELILPIIDEYNLHKEVKELESIVYEKKDLKFERIKRNILSEL